MDSNESKSLESMKFESVLQVNVPKGRDGKHKEIVTQLLSDIAMLKPGISIEDSACRSSRTQSRIFGLP